VSDTGAVLFARYAYPPNELGYCGPAGAAALLDAGAPAEIARRARAFEGAWVYLEYLARAAGLADPLDPAVVSAYWIGNDLLSAGSPSSLLEYLRPRFAGQHGGTWTSAGDRAVAHHSFHVFDAPPHGKPGRGVGAGPLPHPHRRGRRGRRRDRDGDVAPAVLGRRPPGRGAVARGAGVLVAVAAAGPPPR
jgi:hypothetical protein